MIPEIKVLSVSSLNALARELLEDHFPSIMVEGEVSNLLRASSGHIYFTLKDERSVIRAVMFRGNQQGCKVRWADGLKVRLRARLTLYGPRGDLQLQVQTAELAGLGDLQAAFLRLKEKLEQEGLFSNKRPLPMLCNHLAVLTSPQGAVIHDILQVLNRRFPALPITLIPVAVQGTDAADQMIKALASAATLPEIDLVLIARGGGSLEDLWCFNDEKLVRAIRNCPIPVLSAVGHETDFSLCDFAADLRAPTPSAAAEIISEPAQRFRQELANLEHRLQRTRRNWQDLPLVVDRREQELYRAIHQLLARQQQQLVHATRTLKWGTLSSLRSPLRQQLAFLATHLARTMSHRMEQNKQYVAILENRCSNPVTIQRILLRHQNRVHDSHSRLERTHPINRLEQNRLHFRQTMERLHQKNPVLHFSSKQQKITDVQQSMNRILRLSISMKQQQLHHLGLRAHHHSPMATLERGYSILMNDNGIIRSVHELNAGANIQARLKDGDLKLQVREVIPKSK